MAKFTVGVRLHDYGRGTPDEMFARAAADGFSCVQLAYKKAIVGVAEYDDITPGLIAETLAAEKAHGISVAVLGTYVELALDEPAVRERNAQDFKSQLAVCKAVGAGCIGTETTSLSMQPAGTTRERAQYLLCKSLESILPTAEALGVTVAIEPVAGQSVDTPEAARRILNTLRSPNLKIIFDAGNLLTAAEVNSQPQLWARTVSLLGDRIVALHFKGKAFAPDGSGVSASLEASQIDFERAFRLLRTLPQPLPVLREEAVPARAKTDIAWMRRFLAE